MHPLLLLLLVAAIGCLVTRTDASYGLDTALAQAFKADPLGRNDTFQFLKPRLKNSLSNPHLDASQRLQSLESLRSTTPVTVKLVGFSNDQRHELELQLGRYLEVLNKNEHVHVIGTGGGGGGHKLSVRSKIHVEVVRAGNTLGDSMFKAIHKHLDSASPSIHHQPVPVTLVDEIVRADLERPLTSYVIYILNLKRQAHSYGYDYEAGVNDSIQAYSKCLGNYWMGRERYVWIDLAAGPIEYGPALSGEGLVTRNEVFPYAAAAFHGGESPAEKTVLADLASLVWSASQMLFAPAIRIPVYYEPELEVHFYHLESAESSSSSYTDEKKIKWDEIERSLLLESTDGLLLQGQKLVFRRFVIEYDKCAMCAALLSRSTKSYTSRVFLDRYGLFVNEYVDSKELHYLLEQNEEEMSSLAATPGRSSSVSRLVPVYIFDLNVDKILLLDRYHQAVAFRDMVISIRTRAYQTVSEFSCNGRPGLVRTRDVERPVVAALLQTVWGVTPSHLTWNSGRSLMVDYTWSLGHTPFGPFSPLTSLSFVQRDAAPRNLVYSMLNVTVWGAREVLETMVGMGGDKVLLSHAQRAELNKRWNLFMFKLHKATSAVSHFDFNSALFLIKSSEHDLYAFHHLVYKASSRLDVSMDCFTDPPFPWLCFALAFAATAVGLYGWFRREHLFSSKRKRF